MTINLHKYLSLFQLNTPTTYPPAFHHSKQRVEKSKLMQFTEYCLNSGVTFSFPKVL